MPSWTNQNKKKEKAPDFSRAFTLHRTEPEYFLAEREGFEPSVRY